MNINEVAKNLAPEVKAQALKCKTAVELIELAKANKIELTEEQAGEILKASKSGSLSDDELDAVAGGASALLIAGPTIVAPTAVTTK